MNYPKEWTQKEFLQNKIKLEKEGVEVVLVDTILSPIEKADTTIYNPHELKNYPDGTVFVFYCDSGKATLDRLGEYKEKFPNHVCISLKGGRGYWRKNMMLLDDEVPLEGKMYSKHEKLLNKFILCIDEKRYYDAHEALEEIWYPRRFEDDNEVKLLKGFINASVSFELIKRGREKASKKAWMNYLKYRPLLYKVNSPFLNKYHSLARKIEKLYHIKTVF